MGKKQVFVDFDRFWKYQRPLRFLCENKWRMADVKTNDGLHVVQEATRKILAIPHNRRSLWGMPTTGAGLSFSELLCSHSERIYDLIDVLRCLLFLLVHENSSYFQPKLMPKKDLAFWMNRDVSFVLLAGICRASQHLQNLHCLKDIYCRILARSCNSLYCINAHAVSNSFPAFISLPSMCIYKHRSAAGPSSCFCSSSVEYNINFDIFKNRPTG